MKKRKKVVLWGVGIFVALVLVTFPLWIFPLGTLLTRYPGGYAASVESYEEIAQQAGKRDIFIPNLTDLSKLTDEETHTGYRMAMDSPYFWAKPDHGEVYIDLGDPREPAQVFFNRCSQEPAGGGEIREYRGVTWEAYPYENHIKLGGACYCLRSGTGKVDADFMDALTELIIDQYLAREL